jgi:hypothetical protein
MPTPVSYLSGASLSNTVGMFKRGTMAQNLKSSLESGYRWWNGIEVTSSQYLIYSDTYTMGTSTLANSIPVAWSTPDLTDQNLLNLINTLPPRVGQTAFTSLPIALQWLQSSNKFFLIRGGTENIVKSNLEVYLDAGRFDSYIGSGTTVNDLSGNGRNSTLTNGATYNAGGVGSFLLDGTDDKLVGATFTPNITNKTLCAWVKLSSVTQQGGGVINLQGAAGEPFDAIVYNETNNGWGFGSTGFERTAWSGVKETSTTQWVFMCATYANNNYNLYRNGVLILNTTSYNAYTYNVSCRVQMGERHTGGGGVFLAGNVACGMLYSRALSPQEVLQNFNAQKLRFGYYDSVQDGLIFNLDAGNYLSYPRSGTTWTDLTGRGNNGTLTNGPTFSGGSAPSIVFDGADDYVEIPFETILNDCTIEMWFNATSTKIYQYPFALRNTSDGNNFSFFLDMNDTDFGSNAQTMWAYWNSNGNTYSVVSKTGSNGNFGDWNDSTWRNYIFTRSTTISPYTEHYMNGVKLTNITRNGDQTTKFGNGSGYKLALGTILGYSGLNFPGNQAIVRIYNKVLSPQEIIQNFESQRVNFGITGITTNGLVLNLDAANNASYNGSGTTWVDISSSRTDGILTNGPTYVSSGASSSISFDGSDDYVILGNPESLRFNNTFSYGCWFYWTNTDTIGILMGKRNGGSAGYNQFGLTIADTMCCGPAGKNIGACLIADDGTGGCVLSATLPNYVGWVYGIITINTTEQKLYINGALSATSNINFTNKTFNVPGRSFYVGAVGGETEGTIIIPFNNKIANAQVYNRTLSASEVLQNYNATKSRFGI